jgi:erythronate-4-phosphate dehydrogenase
VAQKAAALGMHTLLCDPPLRETTGDPKYLPFENALEADIITFHVPLTDNGPHATWHMLNESVLNRLSPGQFVINASRGPVVDNQALKHALSEKRISGAIIDVWEEEPTIDYSLVELVDIGTPHIAGTSWDGKIRATDMVRQCLSDFHGLESSSIIESHAPESFTISPERGMQGQSAIVSALLKAVDLRQADAALRALQLVDAPQATAGFDRLRKTFPLRPEFRHLLVELDGKNAGLCDAFAALGFKTRINQAA